VLRRHGVARRSNQAKRSCPGTVPGEAWCAWRERQDTANDEPAAATANGPAVFAVAVATFANSGDNIDIYVPVFTTAGTGGLTVFLVLVADCCTLGRFLATRPINARALSHWGQILLKRHRPARPHRRQHFGL
jgi:cadmium resistance protein CadD (predicted permease)